MCRERDLGAAPTLVNELRLEDAQQFKNFIHMSAELLKLLLDLSKYQIVRQDTKFRNAIPIHDRSNYFGKCYKHC